MTALDTAPVFEPHADTGQLSGIVASVSPGRVLVAFSADRARDAGLTVGTLLRIDAGFGAVACVDAVETPAAEADADHFELVIAEARLVGRLDREGGVDPRPLAPPVGARSYLLDTRKALGIREERLIRPVPIGQAEGAFSLEGEAFLDRGLVLCGAPRHTAATMAVVIRSLLRERFPARIVLIDTDDLFTDSFGGAASLVDARLGIVPASYLTAEELARCLEIIGEPLTDGERQVLRSMARGQGGRLQDLISDVERERGQGAPGTGAACASLIRRLHEARDDHRLAPFFGADADRLAPEDVLQALFRLPDGRPPMTLCQLGGVARAMKPLVARVIARIGRMLAEATRGKVPVIVAAHGLEAGDIADQPQMTTPFFSVIGTSLDAPIEGPALLGQGTRCEVTSPQAMMVASLGGGEVLVVDRSLAWPQVVALDPLPDHAQPRSRMPVPPGGDVRSLIDSVIHAFGDPRR